MLTSDGWTDRQTDNIIPKAGMALQFGQKSYLGNLFTFILTILLADAGALTLDGDANTLLHCILLTVSRLQEVGVLVVSFNYNMKFI